MSTRTSVRRATKDTAKQGGRKGFAVTLDSNVLAEALAAPKKVQQGKQRGFTENGVSAVAPDTTRLQTVVLLALMGELGSWRIDGKTGAVEGGKAREYINVLLAQGKSTMEASLAVKKIYLEMGQLRNHFLDTINEDAKRLNQDYDEVIQALLA